MYLNRNNSTRLRNNTEFDSGFTRMPSKQLEGIALAMQEIPSDDRKISILVVDDQPGMLRGLIELVNDSEVASIVVGETDGEVALANAFEYRPDLIILDVSMPKLSGIEIAKKLRTDWEGVKILAVSAHSNDIYVKSMLAAGASGYLLKDNASNELISAIQAIMNGGSWIGQGLTYPPGSEQS